MVSNRTQHPSQPHPVHPLPATHRLYTVLWLKEGGGRVDPERRLEGQQFIKMGRKHKLDWLYLQSIKSEKTCRKVPLHEIFDDDILLWCLYSSLVHGSLILILTERSILWSIPVEQCYLWNIYVLVLIYTLSLTKLRSGIPEQCALTCALLACGLCLCIAAQQCPVGLLSYSLHWLNTQSPYL